MVRYTANKKKSTLILTGLMLLALILVGWISVNYYWLQPRSDRASFSRLESNLDQAVKQITGGSMNVAKETSCSRAEEKYDSGSLVCSIKIRIPNSDVPEGFSQVVSVFNSMSGFQKQGLEQDDFSQYAYGDISCVIQVSSTYYNITCGRSVSRAIY